MAQLANRVAYRLAGLVWTALYAGLSTPNTSGGSSPRRSETFEFRVSATMSDEQPTLTAA
jgi:hypothetical protein